MAGIELTMNNLAEINMSESEMLTTELDKGFYHDLFTLDINPEDFKIKGDVGDYHLTRGDIIIDTTKVMEALKSGDVIAVLDSLGIDKSELTQRTLSYQSTYKKMYNQQPGIKLIKSQSENKKVGNEITKKLGDPDTQSKLDTILDKNPKIKNQLKTLKEKIYRDGSVSVGKWKKGIITMGALSVAGGGLWSIINKHKKEMNGCWLVNLKTGEKCKIIPLTCDDDRTDVCLAKDTLRCGSHLLPEENTEPCFNNNKCIKQINGRCVKTIINACDDNNGNVCSKFCGNINAPMGYKTICVSNDFWGATKDIVSDLSTPISLLSSWWIYIFIIIIFFIFIINKYK